MFLPYYQLYWRQLCSIMVIHGSAFVLLLQQTVVCLSEWQWYLRQMALKHGWWWLCKHDFCWSYPRWNTALWWTLQQTACCMDRQSYSAMKPKENGWHVQKYFLDRKPSYFDQNFCEVSFCGINKYWYKLCQWLFPNMQLMSADHFISKYILLLRTLPKMETTHHILQCGAVITRSIFSKFLTTDTP